jgi:periplasmic protein TonB
MKAWLLYILLILTISAAGQSKESFYVFNAEWQPTKLDSARFLLPVHQVNDSCWQWDYYNFSGPLLKTEQYKDKAGSELDGVCYHYDQTGWLDSSSMYKRGKKNGDFVKMSAGSIKWQTRYVYKDDSLVAVEDCTKRDSGSTAKYADERESEYPGGVNQWGRFLNKNLKYPDRAVKGDIEGEVRVFFIVDREGFAGNPYVAKSVEYSLDEESLRIIR